MVDQEANTACNLAQDDYDNQFEDEDEIYNDDVIYYYDEYDQLDDISTRIVDLHLLATQALLYRQARYFDRGKEVLLAYDEIVLDLREVFSNLVSGAASRRIINSWQPQDDQ